MSGGAKRRVVQVTELGFREFDSLFQAEAWSLVRTLGNGHDHLLEDTGSAGDQVGMTVGDGVKSAGVSRHARVLH